MKTTSSASEKADAGSATRRWRIQRIIRGLMWSIKRDSSAKCHRMWHRVEARLRARSWNASQSHAFDWPMPGEGTGESHAANATIGM